MCNARLVPSDEYYSQATTVVYIDIVYRRAILKLYISLHMRPNIDTAAGASVYRQVSDHEHRAYIYIACKY